MVNMKVLRVFETNNFPFGVILIRTSLLSQKSIGLEEHIVARLLRLGRCCKEIDREALKIGLDENMVNMKVLRIFETNNFYFGVILIRTSLLSQKSIRLEEHIVARLLRLGRCCKEMIGKPSRSAWMRIWLTRKFFVFSRRTTF